MKLYHKAQSTGQGIIADEETGRTVAVVYDSKDGDLLAAAPKLLEALEAMYAANKGGMLMYTHHPAMIAAVEAMEQAKGEL